MLLGCMRIAKHLDQHKAGVVGCVLQYFEANHAGLVDAVPGVFGAGRAKRLYGIGSYMHVNVGDEHDGIDFNMSLPARARRGAGLEWL